MVSAQPLNPSEYANQTFVDPSEVEMLMGPIDEGEVRRSVKPLAHRKTDYVVLYHPDVNSYSSVYLVPMNPTERRMVVARLLQQTKMIDGRLQRWNYPTPQVEPVALPLRCFINGCERRGGFQSRAQLIAHVTGKHSNEAPMYQRLIDALMDQIYKDIPADQYEMYGLKVPDEDVGEMKAGKK